MSKTVDNLLAFKILYMLVTPFDQTNAYKYGIIDKDGKVLKNPKSFTTSDEKNSYTQLDKLVFSLKRLIGKLPGGKSQLASLVAAYWLVKESCGSMTPVNPEHFNVLTDLIESKELVLSEETLVNEFLIMLEDEGGVGVTNVSGAAVATNEPVVKLKNKKPISGIIGLPNYIVRRNKKITAMG